MVVDVPIVIVGGGPTGLFLANLLATYCCCPISMSANDDNNNNDKATSFPFVLLEGQSASQRFAHPQAHFINTRSMELLRTSLPDVYRQVCQHMAPVSTYQYFSFGYNMTGEPLARVIHPVDRPLAAHQNANGTLLPLSELVVASTTLKQYGNDADADDVHPSTTTPPPQPLSVCTIGHLPQHVFCRLLYESVMQKISLSATTNHYCHSTTTTSTQSQGLPNVIQYGNRVVHVSCRPHTDDLDQGDSSKSWKWWITTQDGTVYRSKYCIAADGANSFLRHSSWNIGRTGQEGIQHLMNVYFKVFHYSHKDHNIIRNMPPAMLYSIFHPKLVGMAVRHSDDEFVLQIPFFPPYQTVERDFRHEQVLDMIHAALGIDHPTPKQNQKDDSSPVRVEIVSIQPWTMSALVADRYYCHGSETLGSHASSSKSPPSPHHTDKNIIVHDHDCHGMLVGDAAHVFPPAGGFGMNTGLQDAHSLAWRLAWAIQQPTVSTKKEATPAGCRDIGMAYHQDRRPVAQANAALSVRNYQRLLQITKALFLDEQHPKTLVQLLEQPPLSWSPLFTRQGIFQSLFGLALRPMAFLERASQHPVGRRLRDRVRHILARGGGLPLLFPPFELDFGYTHHGGDSSRLAHSQQQHFQKTKNDDEKVWSADTMGSAPNIRVGYRFPHILVKVVDGPIQEMTQLQFLDQVEWVRLKLALEHTTSMKDTTTYLTTTDLSAQIFRTQCKHDRHQPGPCFCLAVLLPSGMLDQFRSSSPDLIRSLQAMADQLGNETGIHVEMVEIRPFSHGKGGVDDVDEPSNDLRSPGVSRHLILEEVVVSQIPDMLLLSPHPNISRDQALLLCLIRPDGHVADLVILDAGGVHHDSKAWNMNVVAKVQSQLRNAMWQSLIGSVPKKSGAR